ncbi:hypothetical protein Godav_022954 [Gossypium davidsonii]|uniref:Uncharacterized protein n=2 Tax=Gossypium TaxID=3633 RepID=A0A7J8SPY7_GOSDV|nr:hypothetical protein [Gossypium davidsonii]MBA0663900.1 hypothetical protein [Gossypium klotzschianum]
MSQTKHAIASILEVLNPPSSTLLFIQTPRNLITSFVSDSNRATDIIIHFGKHNGKMLGTLPSNYLRWVSKNLRARNYERWAKLADQVYKGRIEWEFAENVLSGNNAKGIAAKDESSVSLLEMSERFGWDNEDKDGWSKDEAEERKSWGGAGGDCAGGSVRLERNQGSGKDQTVEIFNRFPGREALLEEATK